MKILQLEFFCDETEILRRELRNTKESSDKVRKGTYAKINEIGILSNSLRLLRFMILNKSFINY